MLDYRLTPTTTENQLLLEDYLPKLDTGGIISYFESIQSKSKREVNAIEKFTLQLLKLVLSGTFDLKEKFISKIVNFYELERCFETKNENKTQMISRNSQTNLLSLPEGLIILIQTFCTKKELFCLAQVSKEMSRLSFSSYLWRHISFKSKPSIAKDLLIEKITKQFSQIKTLDLSYCDEISYRTGISISQNCDSAHLKELNLDGCRKINDSALKNLMLKYANSTQALESSLSNALLKEDVDI